MFINRGTRATQITDSVSREGTTYHVDAKGQRLESLRTRGIDRLIISGIGEQRLDCSVTSPDGTRYEYDVYGGDSVIFSGMADKILNCRESDWNPLRIGK